jgi:hypothetical protein
MHTCTTSSKTRETEFSATVIIIAVGVRHCQQQTRQESAAIISPWGRSSSFHRPSSGPQSRIRPTLTLCNRTISSNKTGSGMERRERARARSPSSFPLYPLNPSASYYYYYYYYYHHHYSTANVVNCKGIEARSTSPGSGLCLLKMPQTMDSDEARLQQRAENVSKTIYTDMTVLSSLEFQREKFGPLLRNALPRALTTTCQSLSTSSCPTQAQRSFQLALTALVESSCSM